MPKHKGRTSNIDRILEQNRTQGGFSGELMSIEDFEFPDIHRWVDDPVARIAIALLEKSPQTLSEAAARTRLGSEELVSSLEKGAGEFGSHIILISLIDGSRRLLSEALEGPKVIFRFSAFGFNSLQSSTVLAAYAARLCAAQKTRAHSK